MRKAILSVVLAVFAQAAIAQTPRVDAARAAVAFVRAHDPDLARLTRNEVAVGWRLVAEPAPGSAIPSKETTGLAKRILDATIITGDDAECGELQTGAHSGPSRGTCLVRHRRFTYYLEAGEPSLSGNTWTVPVNVGNHVEPRASHPDPIGWTRFIVEVRQMGDAWQSRIISCRVVEVAG